MELGTSPSVIDGYRFFFSLRKVVHHYSNKFPQIASTRSEAEIMNQLIHYLLPLKKAPKSNELVFSAAAECLIIVSFTIVSRDLLDFPFVVVYVNERLVSDLLELLPQKELERGRQAPLQVAEKDGFV